MKLKKIFLIFVALIVFSPALTSVSDYDYLMAKYGIIREKKRIATEREEVERIATEREAEFEKKLFVLMEKIRDGKIDKTLFVEVPGKNYSIMATEVTQKQYEAVMGENPSKHKGDDLPVENVTWYDSLIFCNKLSEKQNLKPCYSYKKSTNVSKWKFLKEDTGNWFKSDWRQFWRDFVCDYQASGYRLPTKDEWQYAAKGGEDYKYAGSYNPNKVGWYKYNSNGKPHPVAQKNANAYGLYDMTGNVYELIWDSGYCTSNSTACGGDYSSDPEFVEVDFSTGRFYRDNGGAGFRLVCRSN